MKGRLTACGALMGALLIADRLTKAWAAADLMGRRMIVIPHVLSFAYTENTGAAFGLLSGMRVLNGILTLALMIGLGIFIWRNRHSTGMLVSGAVVMAGGVSHLYDRLLGRNIIDFIKLEFIDFPIFNVADICICCGAVALAAVYILIDRKRSGKA